MNALLAVIKFTFSHYHKPNEFGFDGLYYAILLKGLQIAKGVNNTCFVSKKAFIYLKTIFIEKLMRRGAIEEGHDRYAVITANRDKFNKRVKESIKAVEAVINDLKLRDFDRALSPHTRGKDQSSGNINAIETITSTLAKGNIKYYPKEIIEYLNRHLDLGIHDSDNVEQMEKSTLSAINDFYTAEAREFIDRIQENETAHYFPTQSSPGQRSG